MINLTLNRKYNFLISMQRLLNKHEKKLNGIFKSLVPCTNDNWQMAPFLILERREEVKMAKKNFLIFFPN